MDIDVGRKILKVGPYALNQGEDNATQFNFKIPQEIWGVDMTGATWRVRSVNIDTRSFMEGDLVSEDGETITISWLVNKNFTSEDGKLEVYLRGTRGEALIAIFKIEGIFIEPGNNGMKFPSPGYIDIVLAQMNALYVEMENINLHPAKAGENGNMWNYNPETGQYEDSGVAMPAGPQGPKGDPGGPGPAGADGKIQSIVGGTNITVNSSNPASPIVSANPDSTKMNVSGGTFTGEAYARNVNRTTLCLRNIQCQNAAGTAQSVSYIITRRQ